MLEKKVVRIISTQISYSQMYYKAKYARPVIQSDFFILYLEVISFFQKATKTKKQPKKFTKTCKVFYTW